MPNRGKTSEAGTPQHPQRRRGRLIAYATFAGAVVLFAGWLAVKPFLRGGDGSARGEVLLVLADMAGFRPRVVRATAGERITLRLESLDSRYHLDGGGRHQLAIDALGVNIIAPARGTAEATFVVSEPGVYPFYCSICCGGKASPAMWGRLIVEG